MSNKKVKNWNVYVKLNLMNGDLKLAPNSWEYRDVEYLYIFAGEPHEWWCALNYQYTEYRRWLKSKRFEPQSMIIRLNGIILLVTNYRLPSKFLVDSSCSVTCSMRENWNNWVDKLHLLIVAARLKSSHRVPDPEEVVETRKIVVNSGYQGYPHLRA